MINTAERVNQAPQPQLIVDPVEASLAAMFTLPLAGLVPMDSVFGHSQPRSPAYSQNYGPGHWAEPSTYSINFNPGFAISQSVGLPRVEEDEEEKAKRLALAKEEELRRVFGQPEDESAESTGLLPHDGLAGQIQSAFTFTDWNTVDTAAGLPALDSGDYNPSSKPVVVALAA